MSNVPTNFFLYPAGNFVVLRWTYFEQMAHWLARERNYYCCIKEVKSASFWLLSAEPTEIVVKKDVLGTPYLCWTHRNVSLHFALSFSFVFLSYGGRGRWVIYVVLIVVFFFRGWKMLLCFGFVFIWFWVVNFDFSHLPQFYLKCTVYFIYLPLTKPDHTTRTS